MKIFFNKYEGTGNDFIIIDNRGALNISLTKDNISFLCHRRFGIGADGLIFIKDHPEQDFEMVYYNSDGEIATMCGNGGRSVAAWAAANGYKRSGMTFMAADGIHMASLVGDIVTLSMNPVKGISKIVNGWTLNTGSPHYVEFVKDTEDIDIIKQGRAIRYSPLFEPEGINANFVSIGSHDLTVRTYERGVEDETLSCGTGVTASAIAATISGQYDSNPVSIMTKGGRLAVHFTVNGDVVEDILLEGPANFVFSGSVELEKLHG